MKKFNAVFLSFFLSVSCGVFFNTTQAANANLVASNIKVTEAWVRASAPGQTVGAAYMTLTSAKNATLINVKTVAAGSVEIHSMSMDNGVMKMRMLEKLDLVAGKPYKLAPGGFHFMLFDLKQPLKAGQTIDFILRVKDKTNKISSIKVIAPVKEE